ncbi:MULTISPECIES: InlB B-repeat-containing protein [Lysinibacillus]|uniref:InlB B-repeat-containing protein n=1 Tax=Lysinibacillus TaxID=400634 RepID=UPI00214B2C8B|nr:MULTISPECIES: InlB B-repeat-containing protein [Lysinibacillus]UUV25576.1 InlB B-repeat-containing protein [Lysinibacillus sp. FN11]UYB48451.1 InlB B-repeat-containing protein [Lysinibacillus capsici]
MRKWQQAVSVFVIYLLMAQIVVGSFPVYAETNDHEQPILTVTLTTDGEPYIDGDIASSPVTIQATTTTVDSASLQVETSNDKGNTWTVFNTLTPLVLTDAGDYHIWFRIIGQSSISKHVIRIAEQKPSLLSAGNSIIYVDATATVGNNDGTSWDNAFQDLQSALHSAQSGQQIWIAQGTYTPTRKMDVNDSRSVAFRMRNGVEIYGGFKGDEETLAQRDFNTYKTILSGALPSGENAYHVFYHRYDPDVSVLNETAILDGVTITGGLANKGTHMYGGGMYNSDGNNPLLRNVLFTGNKAQGDGGGYGGAMYNTRGSNPILTNVLFSGNEAYLGGAIYNASSSPRLSGVKFDGNKATGYGGAIYNGGSSSPTLTNITFTSNEAVYGGGIYNGNVSNPILTEVEFNRNKATQHGGGMYNYASNPTLTNVTFNENEATFYGGALYNDASSPNLMEVTFSGNKAEYGGGMFNTGSNSSPLLKNVLFNKNQASQLGGGMFNTNYSIPSLTDVTFDQNNAINGGGMHNTNSNPMMTTVTFRENKAGYGGGAMSNDGVSNPILTNMIFIGNEAYIGGGMFNDGSSSPNLRNTLFTGNKADFDGATISTDSPTSNIILTNVTISGDVPKYGVGAISGGGSASKIQNSIIIGNNKKIAFYNYKGKVENSLLDVEVGKNIRGKLFDTTGTAVDTPTYLPTDVFMDSSKKDYRLKADSPALDQGNASYPELADITTDLAGKKRVQGSAIDLGAYEVPNNYYNIIYDANGATGGSVPQDDGKYEENALVTVKVNSDNLVKTGYTFKGWNTQADGKGTAYAVDDTFPMGTENIILYAEWVANQTYTVKYDANGATSGIVPQNSPLYEENEKVMVQGNSGNLVRTGYTFKGWNTQADGKGISYAENATFQMGKADVILYAQWTANPTYTVIYNANGATSGTVPKDSTLYEENETVMVQGNSGNLVRTGYTFAGWNTVQDGKGIAYIANTPLIIGEADIILYAQWIANSSTPDGGSANGPSMPDGGSASHPSTSIQISFETNGGLSLEDMEITYNTRVSDLPVPTKEGFRFDGWYIDKALTIQWAEDTLMRENLTLYAKWIKLTVEEQKEPQQKPSVMTFQDIENHWAQDMIEALATQGIIKGYEDGTFRPNESISRQHVASLFTRAFEFEVIRPTAAFSDVAPNHMYYDAIMTLQQAGIIDGADGAFRPTDNITRAQLAKILANTLQLKSEGKSSFKDVDSNHWSVGYIAALERAEITLGVNGKFHPEASVTRAQLAVFLYRAMQQ